MTIFDVMSGTLLFLVSGGAVGLVLLVQWRSSVRQGLRTRTRRAFTVRIAHDVLELRCGRTPRALPLARIARARLATNGNWTESKIVEDALSLFDARGRRVAKVPASAEGWRDLLDVLHQRGVAIEERAVDAPAFLD